MNSLDVRCFAGMLVVVPCLVACGSSTGSGASSASGTTGASTTGGGGASSTTGSAPAGFVTTIAGNGGTNKGCYGYGGDPQFAPDYLALDSSDDLYLTSNDFDEIDADGGCMSLIPNETEQTVGVAVSSNGALFVSGETQIFTVTGGSTLSLLAGGAPGCEDDDAGVGLGDAGSAIAADSAGNVYVADLACDRILVVAPDGTTSTLSGTGAQGYRDGAGDQALFYAPTGIAVDSAGNAYVTDAIMNDIRKITPDGTTSTLAGNGHIGLVDGTGGHDGTARFSAPTGIAVDAAGNLYVADTGDYSIRKVAPDGTTTTLAGNGTKGLVNGTLGLGGTTEFLEPRGIAVDGQGDVYVADDCYVRVIHQ